MEANNKPRANIAIQYSSAEAKAKLIWAYERWLLCRNRGIPLTNNYLKHHGGIMYRRNGRRKFKNKNKLFRMKNKQITKLSKSNRA